MSERIVGIRVGNESTVVPLRMELEDDWVHLRAMPSRSHAVACRVLAHLHYQYFILGIPHRPSLAKDASHLEYIDAISIPRTLAEDYLFPKLGGLADEADATRGVH